MQSDSRNAAVRSHFADGVQRYQWMGSPLYSAFCRRIVDDADLLALAAEARPGQPFTYPLLGAAHMLVLGGTDTPLADYYASVTRTPKQDVDGAFQAFRTFCLDRRSDLLAIMKERMVQLTFVGRAAFVLPALAYVARLAGEPLSFIDVGCSAGLLTMFTSYSYDYGPGRRIGSAADLALAPFRFEGPPPDFLTGIPKLGPVVGIDLNPVSAAETPCRHGHPTDAPDRRSPSSICARTYPYKGRSVRILRPSRHPCRSAADSRGKSPSSRRSD